MRSKSLLATVMMHVFRQASRSRTRQKQTAIVTLPPTDYRVVLPRKPVQTVQVYNPPKPPVVVFSKSHRPHNRRPDARTEAFFRSNQPTMHTAGGVVRGNPVKRIFVDKNGETVAWYDFVYRNLTTGRRESWRYKFAYQHGAFKQLEQVSFVSFS